MLAARKDPLGQSADGQMLLDHFRPPLSERRHWHAFHNAWSTYIASALNEHLPEGYFAEPHVQFGIEFDVAAFEEAQVTTGDETGWAAPAPTQTLPLTIVADVAEVLIFAKEGGPVLAGAIELVSPANKDRALSRDAFVSKCAALLQQGVGLVIVDVVTDRRANLHEDLLARLQSPPSVPLHADLYAVAYRAVSRSEALNLDVWQQPLSIGQPLPTLPLWLKGGISLPVELGASYGRTCSEQRIGA